MVRVIWRDLSKVRVEAEMEYGSDNLKDMLGQYLWGTLQAHWVMNDFLRTQFRQHPEVAPHIKLYLFEHRAPRVEVSDLKQRVEAQDKNLNQTGKTCKELQARVGLLTEKSNRLSNK